MLNFSTTFAFLLAFGVFAILGVTESKKLVRRDSVTTKTRLLDGTRFERYQEHGNELPPLPYGEEESDSRNGHHVKPIIITINTDDQRARVDRVEEINRQRVLSDPYARQRAQRQDENQIQPKQEFLSQQEAEEYDDIPEEPKSSLPDVPKLPKAADYSDSGESDEDLRIQEIGDRRAYEDEERREQVKEVIIPASSIVKIVLDGKNVKKNEEIEENRAAQQAEDLGIQETMDRIPELSDEVEENAEIAEKVAERIAEKIEEEEESLGLTNEDLQNLATDLRKTVFENLMNKANELVDFNSNDQQDVEVGEAVDVENEEEKDQQEEEKEEEEEIILDLPVDPNSIISRSELPSEPEIPRSNVYESEDLDGVLLPGPELSDEEIARIAAESVQEPDEESREFVVDPVPSLPKVRGARIGEGVVPDSASQLHVFVQIFTLSLILLF